jgi:hypothetical protein
MYGIHYDTDDADDVVNAFKVNPAYAALDNESKNREIKGDGFTIILTTNSDRDESSRGAIFVDEMTIEGEDEDDAEDIFVTMEPTELIKSEVTHEKAVNTITDIYDLIVAEFKNKKLDLDGLYLGWSAVSCTWDVSEDEPKGAKATPPPVKTGIQASMPAGVRPKGTKGAKKKNGKYEVKGKKDVKGKK